MRDASATIAQVFHPDALRPGSARYMDHLRSWRASTTRRMLEDDSWIAGDTPDLPGATGRLATRLRALAPRLADLDGREALVRSCELTRLVALREVPNERAWDIATMGLFADLVSSDPLAQDARVANLALKLLDHAGVIFDATGAPPTTAAQRVYRRLIDLAGALRAEAIVLSVEQVPARTPRQALRGLVPSPVRRVLQALRITELTRIITARLVPARTEDTAEAWGSRRSPAALDRWAATYIASLAHPYRQLLVSAVADLEPIGSILELGCHVGPNLRLLAERFPTAEILGVDVNEQIIERAREWLADLPRVRVWSGDLRRELARMRSGSIDCVVTCYVLAYVSAADLPGTLAEALRVARKGVVMVEPAPSGGARPGYDSRVSEWRHDYAAAWRLARSDIEARVEPLPPRMRHERLNTMVTVRKPAR